MIFQRDSIPTHCVEIRNALESNPFMSHKIGGVIEITTATSPPLRAGNKMTVMQGVLFDVFAVQGSFSPEGSDGNEGGVSTISTNESARKLETQSDADDFSILLADIDEENILEHKMFDYETCSAAAERNGGVCQGNPLGRHGGSAGDTGSGTALYMLAPVDDTNVGWSDDNPRFTSPGLTDDGADYTLIANLNMRAFSHRGSDPRLALGVIIEEMPVPQGGKLREALTQIGADIVVVQDLGNTGAMLDNLNDQTRKLEVTNLRRPQKPMRPRFASVLQMLGSRKPPGGKPNIARKLETTKRLSSSIDIFFDTQEYALMSASPMTDLAYSLCHDSSNDGFEDCVSTAMQDFRRAFGSADIPFAATFQVKENREKIFTVVTADFSRVSTLKRAEKAGVNQQIDVFIDYFVVWMRRLASDGVVVRMPGSPGDPPVGPNIVFSGDLGPFFSQAVEFNPLLNMRGQYYTRDGPDGILWGSTEAILPQEQGQGRAQGGTTEIWHINADEPGSFGYDFQRQRPDGVFTGEPMRFSDHDPILYGRRFDNVDVIQCNDNSGCMPGRIQAGGRAPPGNTCKLFPDSVNNGGICGFCTSPYECDDLTHGCALQNVNGVYTRGECGMCEKDFQCRENQFCNNKGECEIEAPLEPGDIAFSCIQNRGDNSNTNDKFGFSILAMVDLPPRTEIYLSDIGRSKDGSQFDARSNEFELKYTLENNGIDMGFQKQFFAEDPETDGLQYTIGSSNSWNFNGGSGDSLFVYTKSEFGSRTQLIGALDFTRDNWETDENDSDDSVKSYLPDARWLNPLYAPETQPNNSKQAKEVRFDFNAHTAGITITKEELWAMMGSRSNWDRAGLSRDDGDCKEGKTADLTLV